MKMLLSTCAYMEPLGMRKHESEIECEKEMECEEEIESEEEIECEKEIECEEETKNG